jgi:sugar phosphate isomerase/epimerase
MEDVRIDRRKFLGAAAGVAGVAALGTWSPWAQSRPNGPNGPIVTRETLGIQHFSVRDATTRVPSTDPNAIKGYLGGPTFPEDPTDLGPLVPLPGGFQEVFAYLGGVGITGFEFYDFAQNQFPVGDIRRAPSNKTIRKFLDDAGMKSFGTHTGGVNYSNPTAGNLAGRHEIQLARDLGHHMIGTATDALGGGAFTNTRDAWLGACETFSEIGETLYKEEGLKLFFHPEGTWWQYFADPDHPELSNTNKLDFFAANTDPRYVFFEIDTYHMYANRGARPVPSDPTNNTLWDAAGFVKSNWKRLVGYHIKDANRILPATPAPPSVPFTQTWTRTSADGSKVFPLNGGVDGIYSLEGHLGNGAASQAKPGVQPRGAGFDPGSNAPGARPGPDPNVIGFRNFFTDVRSTRGRGFEYHIIESDSGPGPYNAAFPANDPRNDAGRSLRLAKYSAKNLLGLK